jgi:translation initiation factor 2A
LHIQPQDELYQASFQPGKPSATVPFPAVIPAAPEPNPSVALYRPKGEVANGGDAKPAGAYRPPGARGAAASAAYSRDADSGPSSGASTPTPMFRGGKPAQRYVPGTAVPGAPQGQGQEEKKKRVRSKRPIKESNENGTEAPVEEMKNVEIAGEEDATAKKIRNLSKKVRP